MSDRIPAITPAPSPASPTPRALHLLALLLLPALLPAQTVGGTVLEDGTRLPIHGATVTVVHPDGKDPRTSRSDSAGSFIATVTRPGTYVVRVSHPAYAATESQPLRLRRDEVVTLELRLAGEAIPLEPLIITARMHDRLAGFRARVSERSPWARFITRTDLAARAGARTTDLFREIPRVELLRVGLAPGIDNYLIAIHGVGGPCLPAILVDGIQLRQFRDSGINDMLHPDMLEGAEIYTSMAGVPPEFPGFNSCGVVAFWTRADAYRKLTLKRIVTATTAVGVLGTIALLMR